MPTPDNTPRHRPISVGHLRSFEAVARHLNFRVAADALALTQSAVSRHIQALESEVGLPLFLRHTRAVELTSAGVQLLRAVGAGLDQIDTAVRHIRQSVGRRSVAIATWASFASMWLIPRMEAFQADHPDIDIRIDASDSRVDLQTADVDVALRYASPATVPPEAVRLFGEQLTPVVSPWLLKNQKLQTAQDLSHFTLIEDSDPYHHSPLGHLSWQNWHNVHGRVGQKPHKLSPKRWLYFNYVHQIVQAALSGQGVALARLPLVAEHLVNGDLIEPLPHTRTASPLVYWLLVNPRSAARPEIQIFCNWLQQQAALTRAASGDVPDPETLVNPD